MGGGTCGTKEGAAIWCNLDSCGLVCAVITYGLVAYAQYAVTLHVLGPWMGSSFFGVVHTVAFNVLACLAHASHARAMLTDPGAVSCHALPPASEVEAAGGALPVNSRRFCRKCNAYKPVRAHHCSICRRCIVKMDHHCPWVNNCVGIGNHKFFLQFISYVFTISVYALALAIGRVMSCVHHPDRCGESSGNMFIVILVIEAVLFGMFTMCMVCDQWETVSTNQTHIDRLKGETHTQSLEINEVFGGARNGRRLRLDFFLPTRVSFPADIWEDVMGYRCRDACGLAAAAVAKVSGGAARADSDDDDADSTGDVEMGEFYAGGSGTMRERRQPAVETQRLLANDAGSGVSGGSGSRSHGGSPLHGHVLPANGSAPPLVLPSVPGGSVVVSNGSGGGGGGGSGFREEGGVRRLP